MESVTLRDLQGLVVSGDLPNLADHSPEEPDEYEHERGHITREATVWCGQCSAWYQVAARTIAVAEREFRRSGWKKTSAHGWVCPDHVGARD